VEKEKYVYKNELAKRDYFDHCRNAQGFSESTISKYAQCIYKWQLCFKDEDFALFDRHKCNEFREFLRTEASKNNTSLSNQYDILRHVKKFFLWLTDQKGYEKIRKTDLDYLRLSKEEIKIALERPEKEIPTIEEIKTVIQSIPNTTEVERRDRALISFLLFTGMRISAVVSLPMEAFNKEKFLIKQSRALNVKTKNSKTILSTFLPINWEQGEAIFLEWYDYLERSREFGATKPIFPATRSLATKSVSDRFWSSSNPAREMIAERCKNAGVTPYNPHSFRHAVVAYMSERGLTEADKRAISLVLGHEHVGTTFGSYGYGTLTPREAVSRVRQMRKETKHQHSTLPASDEELGRLLRDAIEKAKK
jgi:integrase